MYGGSHVYRDSCVPVCMHMLNQASFWISHSLSILHWGVLSWIQSSPVGLVSLASLSQECQPPHPPTIYPVSWISTLSLILVQQPGAISLTQFYSWISIMTLSFRDVMYHFNDELKSKLFTRKSLSPPSLSNCSRKLGCWCSSVPKGRSGSVTVCTVMKHPQNTLSYVLGGADNTHSSTLCKVNTLSYVLGGVGNPHSTKCCKVWF